MAHWRAVLELQAPRVRAEEVVARFRLLAKRLHPDVGGSNEKMVELNVAKTEALKEIAQAVNLPQWAYAAANQQANGEANAIYFQMHMGGFRGGLGGSGCLGQADGKTPAEWRKYWQS